MVRKDINKENTSLIPSNDEQCVLWKSPKCPTENDHKATLALLNLRHSFNNEFANKKTPKNELWQQITKKMNEMGFFVGHGIEGREKARQKFCNLQNSYIKYCDSQKRRGEGKLKIPKYFDQLHEILGDKHKVKPTLIIDTADDSQESRDNENQKHLPSCSSSASSDIPNKEKHRFDNIKSTVRPKSEKQSALEELVTIQKENQVTRKEEFSAMMKMFQDQNEQRHQQIMALISTLNPKKRKRGTSSSEESS